MATIGISIGSQCLGITDPGCVGVPVWRAEFGRDGHSTRLLDLASLDGLREMWTCDAVVLVSDGSYPEANLALTLASLTAWCRRGGVLATVGGAPFLVSQRPDGAVADPGAAVDVTECLVSSTLEEVELRLTRLGRELLGAGALPASLLELDLGSRLPLALYSPAQADEVAAESTRGEAVLSAFQLGQGWWVTWGAAVQPGYAATIVRGVAGLVRRHLPSAPPAQPGIVLDPLRRRLDHGDDEVLGLAELSSAPLELVDQDTSVRWSGTADAHGVARFRVPATLQLSSLGVLHPDLPDSGFSLVAPAPSASPALGAVTAEPADFDTFWADRLAELNAEPPDFELTAFPRFTTTAFTGHRLSYRGAGGLTITGVVTVPRSGEPAPGVLAIPGYASAGITEHLTEFADRAVVASIDVRRVGSILRLPGRGRGPLCEGLDHPDRAGMIAAALDAVRGFQVLAGLCPGGPTAIYGHSQGATLGLAVGALCPDAAGVVAGVPFLVNLPHNLPRCSTDPYVELRWHLERHPEQEGSGFRTLSYLDPRFFLPRLKRPCLLTLAPDDDVAPGMELAGVAASCPGVRLVVRGGGHIVPYLPEQRRLAGGFLHQVLGLPGAEGDELAAAAQPSR